MTQEIIQVKNISKSFTVGAQQVPVLNNISFSVERENFLLIVGPSGCGKSTLLHTVLGLEPPSNGKLIFVSKDIYSMNEDERSDFRKNHIGMVYQQANWIKSLNVQENVAFPLLLFGNTKKNSMEKALDILNSVEMVDWRNYWPTELSAGQQQRVALARALITNPEVIIADEPTGNLDFDSGEKLMELLVLLNEKQKKTILMVTHDLEYTRFAKSLIRMFNGEIVGKYEGKAMTNFIKGVRDKHLKYEYV